MSDWGISAGPSVRSPWFVAQIIMWEYGFSCWKSSKLPLWLRLCYCVLVTRAHVWNREIWAERPQRYFHTLGLTVCHKGHELLYGEVELLTAVLNSVPVAQNSGADLHMAGWAFALSLLLQVPACSPACLAGGKRAEMGDAQDMSPALLSDAEV